jgi:aldose 1-epimerase
MNISKMEFGNVYGKTIYLFTLENDKGYKTTITNYGGLMTSLLVPDKFGKTEDVVLGFDNLADYLKEHPYFGALIGRFGNRIAKGKFDIDSTTYQLAINNGPNHLHGGIKGFDKVVWDFEEISNSNEVTLKLSYLSKDMEEGYPGNLSVQVLYKWNNQNELTMEYFANTDKKTHVNLTQHNYYNLNACKNDIKDHILTLFTSKYTPVDEGLIPTGELANVSGTPFDFLKPKRIGKDLEKANGYDHNFIIDNYNGSSQLIAKVEEPVSGRVMEVYTTQPGTQLYSANFLDGSLTGKYGNTYRKHGAFCLETQHFPDSPNKSQFPSTLLEPGQQYHEVTIFKFSTK